MHGNRCSIRRDRAWCNMGPVLMDSDAARIDVSFQRCVCMAGVRPEYFKDNKRFSIEKDT